MPTARAEILQFEEMLQVGTGGRTSQPSPKDRQRRGRTRADDRKSQKFRPQQLLRLTPAHAQKRPVARRSYYCPLRCAAQSVELPTNPRPPTVKTTPLPCDYRLLYAIFCAYAKPKPARCFAASSDVRKTCMAWPTATSSSPTLGERTHSNHYGDESSQTARCLDVISAHAPVALASCHHCSPLFSPCCHFCCTTAYSARRASSCVGQSQIACVSSSGARLQCGQIGVCSGLVL